MSHDDLMPWAPKVLWGIAQVVHTHNGKQQKAVLWTDVYATRAEATEAARAELNVFGAKPAVAARLLRRRGIHVVQVHMRTSSYVPRRQDL